MVSELEFIQAFSPLLSHIDRTVIRSPLGATAYYVLLIMTFPTSFKSISRKAKEAMGSNINLNKLVKGRQDLLEVGFISRVLPVYDQASFDFSRELFLPISPLMVWNDYSGLLTDIISPEGFERYFEVANELEKIYTTNFGKYGVKLEKGNITIFHNSQWLLRFLAYNKKNNQNISLMLGSLESFQAPFIKYYEDMLRSGLNVRIICDPPQSTVIEERTQSIMNLKKKYADRSIDIKASRFGLGTSRRIIYDNMVIDSKILENDLSYISTIYFETDIIASMHSNFDSVFEESQNLAVYLSQ